MSELPQRRERNDSNEIIEPQVMVKQEDNDISSEEPSQRRERTDSNKNKPQVNVKQEDNALSLEDDNAQLRKKLHTMSQTVHRYQRKSERYQTLNRSLEEENCTLESQNEKLQEENQELESTIKKLKCGDKEESKALKEELEEAKRQKTLLESDSEKVHQNLRDENKELKEEIEELKKLHESKLKKLKTKKENFRQNLRDEKQKYEEEIEKLKKQYETKIEKLESDNGKLCQNIRDNNDRALQDESKRIELQNLKAQCDSLSKMTNLQHELMSQMKQQLQHKEKEIENLRANQTKMNSEMRQQTSSDGISTQILDKTSPREARIVSPVAKSNRRRNESSSSPMEIIPRIDQQQNSSTRTRATKRKKTNSSTENGKRKRRKSVPDPTNKPTEKRATFTSTKSSTTSENQSCITYEKMNHNQRMAYLSNDVNEKQLIEKISRRLEGARCAVCNIRDDNPDPNFENKVTECNANKLVRCQTCDVIVHPGCYTAKNVEAIKKKDNMLDNFYCDSCRYTKENQESEDFEEPKCHMCNDGQGSLKKSFAIPASMGNWRSEKKQEQFKKTLFGKQTWCHSICGLCNKQCQYINHTKEERFDSFNCSLIVKADGKHHHFNNKACELCGHFAKAKIVCSTKKCDFLSQHEGKYKKYGHYHVSCARQAGLEVGDLYELQCYKHKSAEFSFRAKLEDLLEIEQMRSGPNLENFDRHMSYGHAAKLLNFSIYIMQCLGWAWKWAEWWVKDGDTWEPLPKPGQDIKTMTDEELKVVHSTEKSRCVDARRCRLAAFGAALRNRSYDNDANDDRLALDKALRAILHTKSLVGPLNELEINFLADWLGRAYRSKSPLLGFDNEKIPIYDQGHTMHKKDNSRKFELGRRSLPGKQNLSTDGIFEEEIENRRS